MTRESITQSILGSYKECKRKFFYRYRDGLVPKERIPSLDFGRITHRWLRLWHQGRGLDACLEEIEGQFAEAADSVEGEGAQSEALELDRGVAKSMCRAYSQKDPADDFQVVGLEEELYQLSVDLRTCRFFYRNPSACSHWGGCPYRCLCIEDTPEARRSFVRLEERHPELTRVA